MGAFFKSIQEELEGLPPAGPEDNPYDSPDSDTFGVDYDSDADAVRAAQLKMGITADGIYGPNTKAALTSFQSAHGLPPSGVLDPATLRLMGLPVPKPPITVKISTVIAALKQAAAEMGYTLPDYVLSMMIGQLRGAEGAYPGVHSSLGGTNNMGAAQVTQGLLTAKRGMQGWGAFAHKDTSPNARTAANPNGAYIGWYWIAPSPLEAARHWLKDNWWGKALAEGNPQNPTDYAAILYRGGYYEGVHAGDTQKDPNSPAGAANVADYAAAISRGVASPAELAEAPDDPAELTVDPSQFAQLDSRGITEDMFNTAKSGGIGSSWAYLLPPDWATMVRNNGVVWFGPPPPDVPGGIMGRAKHLVASAGAVVKAHPYRTGAALLGTLALIGLVMTPSLRVGSSGKSPNMLPSLRGRVA